ncbi:rim9p [Saccharomyces arboricola H-6]|uniref:Rim9p n=1 Tax=Saccharomyces arboricola (strain H-6 / AS 2.3317 / CBS 10644) TaxID=1160507 RepID=J8Q180_SACAR|nr:rim9p [Saccharomyces arboricola H-6]
MVCMIHIVVFLLTITTVFEIFPLITVPVTKHLSLSSFKNHYYGLFGWCVRAPNQELMCTRKKIGYVSTDVDSSGHVLALPSNSKVIVSNLLVVHPISLAFTGTLLVLSVVIMVTPLGDSPEMLLFTALFSLPTFMLCLLCFLVDILLFISKLDWPGWLMLAAIISVALCCSMLWIMRRVVSVKKYESQQSISHVRSIEQYPIADVHQSKQDSNSSEYEDMQMHTEDLLAPEVTYRGFID